MYKVESTETEKTAREIQLILNVIEPDPEYQAFFISDEACFYDVCGQDEKEIEKRLRFYFKGDLPAPLKMPIWQFIKIVKQRYPGWPDEWPSEH